MCLSMAHSFTVLSVVCREHLSTCTQTSNKSQLDARICLPKNKNAIRKTSPFLILSASDLADARAICTIAFGLRRSRNHNIRFSSHCCSNFNVRRSFAMVFAEELHTKNGSIMPNGPTITNLNEKESGATCCQ